jgi:hypothetical protein
MTKRVLNADVVRLIEAAQQNGFSLAVLVKDGRIAALIPAPECLEVAMLEELKRSALNPKDPAPP